MNRRADDTHEHNCDFAARDVVKRAEAAVRVAAQDAFLGGSFNISAAPAAGLMAVREGQVLSRQRLQHQVAAQHGGRFLARQRCFGRCSAFVGALKIARSIGRADIVIIPVFQLDILKRLRAGFGIAESTVEQGDKLRSRDRTLRFKVAILIAAHDIPRYQTVEVIVFLCRMGGRGYQREKV